MTTSTRSRATRPVGAVVLAALIGAALWFWASGRNTTEVSLSGPGVVSPDVTTEELATVARTRVFFGHQSVGMNILDGVPAVYAAHGVTAPRTEQGRSALGASGGYIEHDYVGENEKPLLKIQDFDKAMRSGIGAQVDVAMLKFCYVDIMTSTDVDALFATYRDTMSALERDFPQVTFVKVTVPLTTERSGLARIKARFTGNERLGPRENAARERLNTLIRTEYAGDHLLDLAAIESTAPDGSRSTGSVDGQPYFTLDDGYASDIGHLNAQGSRIAAIAWLKAVAQATE